MVRKTRGETLETRNKLLESAFDVMSEKPFSSVTMSEIAERVGLSKGAAYWHFRNKNDILIRLIQDLCKEMVGEPEIGGDAPDSLEQIRVFYKNRLEKNMQGARLEKANTLFHRKMEWPKEVHEKVELILRDRILSEQKIVERLLSEAQGRGEVRPDFSPGEISSLIAAVFLGLFILFGPNPLYPKGGIDLMQYVDFIFDAFGKELKVQPI